MSKAGWTFNSRWGAATTVFLFSIAIFVLVWLGIMFVEWNFEWPKWSAIRGCGLVVFIFSIYAYCNP